MLRNLSRSVGIVALTLSLSTIAAQAQDAPAAGWSQTDGTRVVKEIQKQLGGLTNYGVFDWVTFGVHGKTVVLHGYASRPTLKDDAERAIKGIPGVESVENKIEVLPLSPNDDRIRAGVYNRIYTSAPLRKYNANAGSLGRGLSVARMAGGITNDPPTGYHAIHIIVENGHVTLHGIVLNFGDATIANMQANSTPGAFSVDSELIVEHARAEK